MTPALKIDEKWTTDTTYLRFNLTEAISAEKKVKFWQAVVDWMDRGMSGEYGPTLAYLDDKFEWYDGPHGRWVEFSADLGLDIEPSDLIPALDALAQMVSPFPVASIQVGSGSVAHEADWPYPPEVLLEEPPASFETLELPPEDPLVPPESS